MSTHTQKKTGALAKAMLRASADATLDREFEVIDMAVEQGFPIDGPSGATMLSIIAKQTVAAFYDASPEAWSTDQMTKLNGALVAAGYDSIAESDLNTIITEAAKRITVSKVRTKRRRRRSTPKDAMSGIDFTNLPKN